MSNKSRIRKGILVVGFIALLLFLFTLILVSKVPNSLKEYKIKFSCDIKKYVEERDIVYQYLIKFYKKKFDKIDRQEIGIDLYDLNGDGDKEILAYFDNGYCGPGGVIF